MSKNCWSIKNWSAKIEIRIQSHQRRISPHFCFEFSIFVSGVRIVSGIESQLQSSHQFILQKNKWFLCTLPFSAVKRLYVILHQSFATPQIYVGNAVKSIIKRYQSCFLFLSVTLFQFYWMKSWMSLFLFKQSIKCHLCCKHKQLQRYSAKKRHALLNQKILVEHFFR